MHEELLKHYFERESTKGDLSAEQWESVLRRVRRQKERGWFGRVMAPLTARQPCPRHSGFPCHRDYGWGDFPLDNRALGRGMLRTRLAPFQAPQEILVLPVEVVFPVIRVVPVDQRPDTLMNVWHNRQESDIAWRT